MLEKVPVETVSLGQGDLLDKFRKRSGEVTSQLRPARQQEEYSQVYAQEREGRSGEDTLEHRAGKPKCAHEIGGFGLFARARGHGAPKLRTSRRRWGETVMLSHHSTGRTDEGS